jgi:hypothetical protein
MTPDTINIIAVQRLGQYRLHLVFDDGREQTIDFKPFLSRALHPEIKQWLEPKKFALYRLEYGELVWGDYELCFPIIDLYRNDIEHHLSMESAA